MSDPGIIIGDVHGCIRSLESLYKQLPAGRDIYCVGDLIDRGENSPEVVDFVIDNGIESVMGNHEHMMLVSRSIIKNIGYLNPTIWEDHRNGGNTTLVSYKKKPEKWNEHINFLKNLPMYIQIDDVNPLVNGNTKVLITHSGVYNSIADDLNNITIERVRFSDFPLERSFLFNRHTPTQIKDTFNIFGHTPVKQPYIEKHFAMIDGGCVYGYNLFALDLSDMTIYCQKCMDKVYG